MQSPCRHTQNCDEAERHRLTPTGHMPVWQVGGRLTAQPLHVIRLVVREDANTQRFAGARTVCTLAQ